MGFQINSIMRSTGIVYPRRAAYVTTNNDRNSLGTRWIPITRDVAKRLGQIAVITPSNPATRAYATGIIAKQVVVVSIVRPKGVFRVYSPCREVWVVLLPIRPPRNCSRKVAFLVDVFRRDVRVIAIAYIGRKCAYLLNVSSRVSCGDLVAVFIQASTII